MCRTMRFAGLVLGALGLAPLPVAAFAIDGLAFDHGSGGGRDLARVAVQWQWQQRWLQSGGRHAGGYWDLSAGVLGADALPGQNARPADTGFTPTLRWQRDDLRGLCAERAWVPAVFPGPRWAGTAWAPASSSAITSASAAASGRRPPLTSVPVSRTPPAPISSAPLDGLDVHQLRLQYWFR